MHGKAVHGRFGIQVSPFPVAEAASVKEHVFSTKDFDRRPRPSLLKRLTIPLTRSDLFCSSTSTVVKLNLTCSSTPYIMASVTGGSDALPPRAVPQVAADPKIPSTKKLWNQCSAEKDTTKFK